jgi:hypothetical protein
MADDFRANLIASRQAQRVAQGVNFLDWMRQCRHMARVIIASRHCLHSWHLGTFTHIHSVPSRPRHRKFLPPPTLQVKPSHLAQQCEALCFFDAHITTSLTWWSLRNTVEALLINALAWQERSRGLASVVALVQTRQLISSAFYNWDAHAFDASVGRTGSRSPSPAPLPPAKRIKLTSSPSDDRIDSVITAFRMWRWSCRVNSLPSLYRRHIDGRSSADIRSDTQCRYWRLCAQSNILRRLRSRISLTSAVQRAVSTWISLSKVPLERRALMTWLMKTDFKIGPCDIHWLNRLHVKGILGCCLNTWR